MKHSQKQLRTMLKTYLTKVADATQWDRLEEDELNRFVKTCRFAFIENYSRGERFPRVDVLFLLSGDVKNYLAFTVENGALTELHQEHLAEFCLTCGEREAELQQGPF